MRSSSVETLLRMCGHAALLVSLMTITLPAAAPTADKVQATDPHQRVVQLEGGQNFRDLGGYRTRGGRFVKWGLLYRAGAMARLTDHDFAKLQRRDIRTVIDLRSTEERIQQPTRWPASFTPTVVDADYKLQSGALFTALAAPGITPPQARVAFEEFYAELPFQFAGQYRAMFARLLAGQAPLVVNCSAGKDRTGVAAALLLTALGVPRNVIMDDYLLSNQNFDPGKTLATDAKSDGQWRRLPPDVMKVMMGVDAFYLDAAFAAIDRRPGGMNGYMRDQLGLTRADLGKLQKLYLD